MAFQYSLSKQQDFTTSQISEISGKFNLGSCSRGLWHPEKRPGVDFFASNLKEESEFSHLSSKLEISPQEKVY